MENVYNILGYNIVPVIMKYTWLKEHYGVIIFLVISIGFVLVFLMWNTIQRFIQRFIQWGCGHQSESRRLEGEMTEMCRQCDGLRAQLEDYRQRLSAEMGSKISANESSVENIGIRNRSMNISKDYQSMCSNEWHDAKCVCDDMCADVKDSDKLSLLNLIITLAEKETKDIFQQVFGRTRKVLTQPFSVTDTDKHFGKQSYSTVELPIEVTNAVGDYLRNSADIVDFTQLEKSFIMNLEQDKDFYKYNEIWTKVKDQRELKVFISRALQLAWKMVLQRPPMTYKSCNTWQGNAYQDLYWNGIDPQGRDQSSYITVPVYPILYHSHHLMAKGKVYIIPKGEELLR